MDCQKPSLAALLFAVVLSVLFSFGSVLLSSMETQHLNAQLVQALATAKQNEHALRLQIYCEDLAIAHKALLDGDLSRYDFHLRRHAEEVESSDLRDAAWYYLWQQGHPTTKMVFKSDKPLYAVRLNHQQTIAITCGAAGKFIAFEQMIGQNCAVGTQGRENLTTLFSPDEELLATAGDDGTIAIWN